METHCLPHSDTHSFSPLNLDYLDGAAPLRDRFDFRPNDKGLDEAIRARESRPVDRELLARVIKDQYQGLTLSGNAARNLELLDQDQTFTVCTAHQPNLMTGYLYFVYKIAHAIKLAGHLAQRHPGKHFVPVFYMGSEDNDLDELGVFNFRDRQFRWQTDQTGAVGRMSSKDLKPLLQEWARLVGPPGPNAERLLEIVEGAYKEQPTIAAATRYLVNELLGKYGVLVLDPDDARLKRKFVPIAQDELLHSRSHPIVSLTGQALTAAGHKTQAFSRPINLFYLKDDMRERIVKEGERWKVWNTSIEWSRESLEQELEDHPERFSPNVILRGLFQELILPDVAFIGGGSEIAYWLQLKDLFHHYGIFFPALVLRQSFLIEEKEAQRLQGLIGIPDAELFLSLDTQQKQYLHRHSQDLLDIEEEKGQLERLGEQLRAKAKKIDPTLEASADAALQKMRKPLEAMEKKMMAAEKKRSSVHMERIARLKGLLFPKGKLQERYETFLPYYLKYGDGFFESLLESTLPYGDRFLILKETL